MSCVTLNEKSLNKLIQFASQWQKYWYGVFRVRLCKKGAKLQSWKTWSSIGLPLATAPIFSAENHFCQKMDFQVFEKKNSTVKIGALATILFAIRKGRRARNVRCSTPNKTHMYNFQIQLFNTAIKVDKWALYSFLQLSDTKDDLATRPDYRDGHRSCNQKLFCTAQPLNVARLSRIMFLPSLLQQTN